MQVYISGGAADGFIDDDKVFSVNKEYGTAVLQVFVAGIFSDRYLHLAFRFP